jgi:lysyl-tRNA synthetase, class II
VTALSNGVVGQRTEGPSQRWRPWVPVAVAWTIRISAVLTLLDSVRPSEEERSAANRFVDAALDGAAFGVAALAAGAMLLIAGALRRRKRRAWVAMVIVLTVAMIAHGRGHRFELMAMNALLLGGLLWTRRDFTARSERRGRLAALRVLVVLGGVSVLVGLLLAGRTAPESSFGRRLTAVLEGLVGFTPDLNFRSQFLSDRTEFALNSLGAMTALLFLLALLAPTSKPPRMTGDAERGVRELLTRFGSRDSLGYFALRRDKTAVFSPSNKAAVVYRVEGSVSLASGDPLGDPEAWPGAIAAWLAEAEAFAYIPAVVGTSEEGALAYSRFGLDALELGDEAVLDLREFSLEGRSMRVVRQAVNRVARAGYSLDVRRQHELSGEELNEVMVTAEALRGEDVERGFSMALGRLGDPADPELVVAQARDAEHRLVAVLAFVPWGDDGLSLDLMRRARDSENGTVEFVVVGVAQQAATLGINQISLNFAVFRSVFERGSRVGAGPVLRIWRRCLLLASRWWQIESLYRANAKYNPIWVPRFVCFRRAGELPRVAVAALQAEAFLARPRLRWLAR